MNSAVNEGEGVALDGLKHSERRLEAKFYQSSEFSAGLLCLLRDELHLSSWRSPELEESGIKILKVSTAFSNDIFFVSYPTPPGRFQPVTVLLRVYRSTALSISRPRELHTLHTLSAVYGIVPRLFGTFANGRVEEFIESLGLTPSDTRDPQISQWIARRMWEVHQVDIAIACGEEWRDNDKTAVQRNVGNWITYAPKVLDRINTSLDETHPWSRIKEDIDIDRFALEWNAYVAWLKVWAESHTPSPRVFAHNDVHYMNLLRLANPLQGQPDHHHIMLIDFEYAAPNPAAYDIANHFHEWMADYQSDQPHVLNSNKYPSLAERRNFYRAYLSPEQTSDISADHIVEHVNEDDILLIEDQVRVWAPATMAHVAAWSIVQAEEDVIAGRVGEFDSLNHSRGRIHAFRAALKGLGIEGA